MTSASGPAAARYSGLGEPGAFVTVPMRQPWHSSVVAASRARPGLRYCHRRSRGDYRGDGVARLCGGLCAVWARAAGKAGDEPVAAGGRVCDTNSGGAIFR
jgi:hypothetical protein